MIYHIGIVGSRDFRDEILVRAFVSYLPLYLDTWDFKVVSGGARGVDTWAKEEARKRFGEGRFLELPAKWTKTSKLGKAYYDPGAGFERNAILVGQCNEVIIFWDGKSKGSNNVKELCEKNKVEYHLVRSVEDMVWK